MTMLQIGPVAFEASGPSFDKLKRHFKSSWASQKRFGRRNAKQNTGIDDETIAISGTIYTDYHPGFQKLAMLRSISGTPQMVVSGAGDVFGLWVITEVEEEQSYQDAIGRPGKIAFTVKLSDYGEDGGELPIVPGVRLW